MKTKTILAVALAALTTFASCSKEENGDNPKEGETTRVVLNVQKATETRGTGSAVGAHTVAFTDGYVVFANSSDVATDVFTIVTGTPDANNREINIATGEISFDEVSGESRSVYILGNVGTLTITPKFTNIETLVANPVVTAKSQTNDPNNSNVTKVTLYGETGTINHAVTPSVAAITVAPIGSRIEIAKFTGTGDVGAYRIDGIFVNNFYNTIAYNGTMNSAAGNGKLYFGKEADGQNPVSFKTGGATCYAAADAGYFYDENTSAGLGSYNNLVTTPTSGVWAYNIPAPIAGEFPHIVVRVSNITVDGTPLNELRWMTVTKFVYADGTNADTDVPSFEAGKIYKIADFEFNETHLDVAPEMKTVTAKVTVTLAQWEPINVKPW